MNQRAGMCIRKVNRVTLTSEMPRIHRCDVERRAGCFSSGTWSETGSSTCLKCISTCNGNPDKWDLSQWDSLGNKAHRSNNIAFLMNGGSRMKLSFFNSFIMVRSLYIRPHHKEDVSPSAWRSAFVIRSVRLRSGLNVQTKERAALIRHKQAVIRL